jgi:TRAP transporter TAXI family solute receptor
MHSSLISGQQAHAQQAGGGGERVRAEMKAIADRMNANTLMLVTATPGLTYAAYGYDLANVLNDGDNFRILPIVSESALHNIRDVRFLRGVDLGFVQTNIFANYRKTGEIPDLPNTICYLFKVSNEEVQIISRSDTAPITSIEQLRGQTVNFNTAGSGNQMTARDLFGHFGVTVNEVNMRQQDGLEKLKNGEIAATVLTAGKPSSVIKPLKASDGYRIVPIPFDKTLIGDYMPAPLTHEDYPNLLAAGESVDTVATGTLMIAYNWPKNTDRYRRIDDFVKRFFPRLGEFQKPPRNEKWRETNLFATVPGWKRCPVADEWLRKDAEERIGSQREQFQDFVAKRQASRKGGALSDADRNELFEDFVKWIEAQKSR